MILYFKLKTYEQNADDVCKYWQTLKGNTQIEIYKTPRNTYEGKIVWLQVEKD